MFDRLKKLLPISNEFELKVKINKPFLYWLNLGYLVMIALILVIVFLTGKSNEKEVGVSSVVTSVRGADMSQDKIVWDSVDYVYPPQEVKAFFITTRAAITQQRHEVCPDNTENSRCFNDTDCKTERYTVNGVQTGKCDRGSGMCLINAWCPVENLKSKNTKVAYLKGAMNFTVYVRNHEEFIKFNISRSNDPNSIKSSTNCLYNKVTDPTCPIFKIGDILKEAGVKFEDIKLTGGVFQFYIKWKCYFNWYSEPCIPKYSFQRISRENADTFAGYKTRYANYHERNGQKVRELVSVNGLRFLMMIKSSGEKFNFFTFLSSFGSYLNYLSIWTFIIVIYCAIILADKEDVLCLDEYVLRKLVQGKDKDKSYLEKSNDTNGETKALDTKC